MGLINVGKDFFLELQKSKLNLVSEEAKLLFNIISSQSKNQYDGTYKAILSVRDLIEAFKLKGKKVTRECIGKLANELRRAKLVIFSHVNDEDHEYLLGEKNAMAVSTEKECSTEHVTDVGLRELKRCREIIENAKDLNRCENPMHLRYNRRR